MDIRTTPLEGVLVLKPKVFRDARGHFVESWRKNAYVEAGIDREFVQDNHSSSVRNVLRGIHFQLTRPQGKLINVSLGRVFDVAVDLRPSSSSFGRWFGLELSQEEQNQLWIPPGLGHGFCVLSETAHFHYKCTDYYVPGDEGTVAWNDPGLNIPWPTDKPILSEKDAAAPALTYWMGKLHG